METGPLNLDEIEARANAATPGPWTYHDGCGYVEVPPYGAIEFKPGWERSVHFLARVHNNHVEGEDGLGFDGAFIAAARTDVPALIARVRELEEEREQIRARLEEECERTRGLEHERDGLAIALEATETMLVAFLDRAERVLRDGQEWVERETARGRRAKATEGWEEPGANVVTAGDLIGLRRKE